jgi:hypothetical protein
MNIFLPIAEVSVNIVAIFSLSGVVGILSGLFGVGGFFNDTFFNIFRCTPTYAVANKVKSNIAKLGYPMDKLYFKKIDAIDKKNLKSNIIGDIAISRCDTDFYDSTLSILKSLYYKVIKNGYIIYDDYGHWKGHYDACHEFYNENNIKPFFIRTCRKEVVEVKSV